MRWLKSVLPPPLSSPPPFPFLLPSLVHPVGLPSCFGFWADMLVAYNPVHLHRWGWCRQICTAQVSYVHVCHPNHAALNPCYGVQL